MQKKQDDVEIKEKSHIVHITNELKKYKRENQQQKEVIDKFMLLNHMYNEGHNWNIKRVLDALVTEIRIVFDLNLDEAVIVWDKIQDVIKGIEKKR